MIAGRATSPAWAIRVIADYRVEAALALLARLVEHRECLQAPPCCSACAQRPSAPRGPPPLLCAGIARLRRSAALLVASVKGHPSVVSEKGSAHRG